ncbi:hypothetical protein OCC_07968 [Thermococcus litoralis DSM 5473]|uniref:Uncharacterized protein n=1 Tax=Thermococcus litoralis (strain ATCC 51850 / DSM 5473 / JCM 8560 / NS-C) TaxID=523849 RepID=H3ZKY6_THELN|nr:hypothetical protein [Thermococcus litoralis]EHR79387.1 hypothetical protein OCC_07968 [Thermococcus litoralis DSM 5473]
MRKDPLSGIGDSLEDVIGGVLISIFVGIWGMVVTILVNVAIQLNVLEAASWTLQTWGLFLLVISALDIVGVFALGMIGLFASVAYVLGRIFGYGLLYWCFSLIHQIMPSIPVLQLPTASVLLNIFILLLLLIVRIGMSENQEVFRW